MLLNRSIEGFHKMLIVNYIILFKKLARVLQNRLHARNLN